jgi:hypothetical protein
VIAKLEAIKPEVSEGMIELADRIEEVAKRIRSGEIRAAAICYVESGPEMYVSSDWASMSGRITMVGGLFRLLTLVSDA